MEQSTYQIIYYTLESGKSPIRKFIESIDKSSHAKVLRIFERFKKFGFEAIKNHTKKITDTALWEIKILGKQSVRLLYFYQQQNTILIVHGFIKKNKKLL